MFVVGERYVDNTGNIFVRILKRFKDRYLVRSEHDDTISIMLESEFKELSLLKPSGYFSIFTIKFSKDNYGLFIKFTHKYSYRFKEFGHCKDIICACICDNQYSVCMDASMYSDNLQYASDNYDVESKISKHKPHALIAMYLDDTPDDVLGMLGRKRLYFDKIITEFVLKYRKTATFPGMYLADIKDLKSYLSSHHFWRSVDLSMEIIPNVVLHNPIRVEFEDDGYYILNNEDLHAISMHLSYCLKDIFCVKFGYDIDFGRFTKDYIMLRDTEGALYVLSYKTNGLYVPAFERTGLNKEDLAFMLERAKRIAQ